ncbi:MAG: hypothetical protein O2968_13135, partial [Acidobacteria bacterium]|nr:hypothetical protein [Acidobacteriota bacterium]
NFAPPVNGLESPLCGLFSLRRLHSKGRILRVPVGGGEAVETGLIHEIWSDEFSREELDARLLSGLSISPDGTQISFSVREKEAFGLWVLENFLPQLTQAE